MKNTGCASAPPPHICLSAHGSLQISTEGGEKRSLVEIQSRLSPMATTKNERAATSGLDFYDNLDSECEAQYPNNECAYFCCLKPKLFAPPKVGKYIHSIVHPLLFTLLGIHPS